MGDGPVQVISSNAEQMFLDITPAEAAGLPHYTGEMELTNHSAGSLTSQAYQKRWLRKEELLADAAEEASLAAEWLGARHYPLQRLNDAWTLQMGGHFHDLAAGTATPRSYEFAWNDDVIAMNQFAAVFTDATEGVAAGLNTETKGIPLIVFNSLGIPREDVVEASLEFPGGMPGAVHVVGPDGKDVPAQISDGKVLFLARVPSVGYAVYDVQPGEVGTESQLKVSDNSLENQYYRVKLNRDGDVESIFDKSLSKELLVAPARLAISYDNPKQWPAWNMDWDQEQAAPKAYVSGPAKIRVVENGPVRVAIEISRETAGSHFAQRPPFRWRRGQARRIRQRHRLEHQGIESEGDLSAFGLQRVRDLQLGHRHDPAPYRQSQEVRGRFAPVDRSDGHERRVWCHHPHRLQEWIRQAHRQHHSPHANPNSWDCLEATQIKPRRISAITNSFMALRGTAAIGATGKPTGKDSASTNP